MVALSLALILAVTPSSSPPPDASATRRGLVNTSAQSFGGTKTFDGGIVTDLLAGSTITGFAIPTATTATMTLYLDPAGSDSNACTSSGAGACLTLAGVLAKLPTFINHNVTVNIAAGAYGQPFLLNANMVIASGVTVTFTGTQTTFTPATGTSSGTTTASAGGGTAGHASLTDSGQSWTTSNLVGRFVLFASGALSGQAFPITANTGTTISFPSLTAAGTGVTYSLVDAGSTFISATAANVLNILGGGSIALSNLWIERTSGITMTMTSPTRITATNIAVRSASTAWQQNIGVTSFTRSYLSGVSALNEVVSTTAWSSPTFHLGTNNFYKSTSAAAVTVGSPSTNNSFSGCAFETATGTGLSNTAGINVTVTNGFWVNCTTSGTGVLAGAALAAGSGARYTSLSLSSGATRISGCTTAVSVNGYSYAMLSVLTVASCTNGVVVTRGGAYDFNNDGSTFTTVTNELTYDGTVATFAALDALAAPKIFSTAWGSRIIR